MSLSERNDDTGWQALLGQDECQFICNLDSLDCPIWTAPPHGVPPWKDCCVQPWAPIANAPEFRRPLGWQQLSSGNNLDRLVEFEPGWCVCVNLGGQVAVVDVDSRNGGDIEAVRALLDELGVRVFAEVDTPSGGKHFYVAGHPALPTLHQDEKKVRLAGFPGLEILSYRTNAFLPGTERPKYGWRGYTIVFNGLAKLAEEGDDEGAAALTTWVYEQAAERVGGHRVARPRATGAPRRPAHPLPPGLPLQSRYRARRGLVRFVRGATEGNRNGALHWAGCQAIRDGLMAKEGDLMYEALAEAAACAGLPDHEIHRTLRSALQTVGGES